MIYSNAIPKCFIQNVLRKNAVSNVFKNQSNEKKFTTCDNNKQIELVAIYSNNPAKSTSGATGTYRCCSSWQRE